MLGLGVLKPEWLARIRALPEVVSVSTGRTTCLPVDGVEIPALVMLAGQHSEQGFAFLDGGATAWQRFVVNEGVLVSEPFAYHHGKSIYPVWRIGGMSLREGLRFT